MEALTGYWKRIPRWVVICFASALFVGVLTHMYMLTNKLPNHDDVAFIDGAGYTLRSGRWFLEVLRAAGFGGKWSVPWAAGIIAFLCVGGSSCLLLSVLDQRDHLSAALLPALLVTFPSMASVLSFMFFADLYFFGVLLTCAAVYLTRRGRWGFLPGGVLLGLALGVYQAYVCLAAGALLLCLLAETLRPEGEKKQVLYGALRAGAALVIGVGLYYGVLQILLNATDTALMAYQGLDRMGQFSVASVPGSILNAYRGFFRYFITRSPSLGKPVLPVLNGLLGAAMGGLLLGCLLKKENRRGWKIVFSLLLMGLLLLALAGVYVMAPNSDVHMVTSYQYVLLYAAAPVLLAAFLRDRQPVPSRGRLAAGVTVLLLALIMAENFVLVNHAYMASQLAFHKAYAYFERMVLRIEESGEFAYGDTLAIVGPCHTDVFGTEGMNEELKNMTGFDGASNMLDYDAGARHDFITNYIGLNAAYDDDYQWNWRQIPEIVEMPAYPAEGSIKRVGDAVIVKMGD